MRLPRLQTKTLGRQTQIMSLNLTPAFCRFFASALVCLPLITAAQVDQEINRQLWKQKYGVLDAQMNEQAPYVGWLSQDADADGVKNADEFLAGTSPFLKLPTDANFHPPSVTGGTSFLSLSFPTVPGKLYGVESNQSLLDAWMAGSLPSVTGDGSTKTLVVPMSVGRFFHLFVTDQASQGDMVSDWAKIVLGLSPGSTIGAQTSFNHTSLASNLQMQNVVTLTAVDATGTQPPDGSTAATDTGLMRITRSGYVLLGSVTVPIVKSGTAIEGIDYATLPTALTFPAGVNSLDIKVTPLFNLSRTGSGTIFITASSPGSNGATGNYTLGNPNSAGMTLYPPARANGTGLTGNYYRGGSTTYANILNFDGVAASYSYSKTTALATVTYSGTPDTAYAIGSPVNLQFTSGNLGSTSPFYNLRSYSVTAFTTNSFTVTIAGGTLPNSSSGNVTISGFKAPLTRLDPTVDFNWSYGTPNGNTYVGADNHSVTWDGWLSPSSAGSYLFRLDADDKARVLIDTGSGLQQILENGWDTVATGTYKQSTAISLVIPPSAAARYPIRVEYAETTGNAKCKLQWQVNGATSVNIPSTNVFANNTDSTAGWNAVFYNNSTLTPPAARTQIDSAVTNGNNGDWGVGTPDPSIFHNNFSIRWTGQILPQYSQTYYFVGRVDDGVKLWVNNQLIVDRWPGGGVIDSIGSIDLLAGVPYDIKMEYFENTGAAESHLLWYSDDQVRQVVPPNRLFPTITGTAPRAGDPPAAAPAITNPTSVVYILGSSPPFAMPLASSNGGTISVSGLPAWLTFINGVLSGTPTTAGIYQFTVTTTNVAGSSSVVITLEVKATGSQLTRELWTSGVTGPALADVPWTTQMPASDMVTSAEDSTNYGANSGERLRGYFTAPSTGNYYFWIAASGNAELWISNNSEPVNKVRRAIASGTNPRTWDAKQTQKSPWLSLVAGKKYYLEALHNTGAGSQASHLSVAWFVDPTGNSSNPVANNSSPASATVGGIMPGPVLSPWDNPPTTSVPGTLYVTNLQGLAGLGNITATGGSFLRVNGSSAVLQLDYSGLSSGATSRKLYNNLNQVIFDLDAQDRNYPGLKTTDGAYSWSLQPADLTALNNGGVRVEIATFNHPAGEVTGTFGKISGSQTAPAVPDYPAWSDLHASSDAANSRFLSQATFGPSPTHMTYVKNNGYRPWLENQFGLSATHHVPYILANLSNDPQNLYGSSLFFNSWWKNSVSGADQLRQRAAFALSEILVVSDVGPLNNNGRILADYYDTLLDRSFENFRDILKSVTLSPAMGVYLDMRGNVAGNIQTGLHPNENYAREIMQLFSAGLYRVWPDGTLVLDSKGSAVPTYDQNVITGMARVFTGWNWGQALVGGRLPTSSSPLSNYFDPMVLVANKHELGTKILLDNVVLPAAIVTSQTDTSNDPSSTYTVESPDGAGNLTTTTLTNNYDLNGVKDLESTLDSILKNPATGPYICRQLIQRLVTSHPKPAYVHRVVRAFNGEQNIDGVATGIRGDMKDVFRAILLDSEARSATAAADVQFGKQREPLLRLTGPARTFPPPSYPSSAYRELGYQPMLIKTPVPHRLINGETILLSSFTDSGAIIDKLPTTQSYTTANTTPAYSLYGPTGIVTITAPGYQAGDSVALQFTSGTLGTTAPFNTVQNYTVQSASTTSFTIDIGVTTFVGTITGNTLTPNNFTVNNNSLASSNYNNIGSAVTITSSGYVAGQKLYVKFSSGGLLGAGIDGIYTIASAGPTSFTISVASSPSDSSGSVLIPRLTGGYNVITNAGVSTISFQTTGNHNLSVGGQVQINFLIANLGIPAQSIVYTVDSVIGPNSFQVTAPSAITSGSQGSTGMVAYPLAGAQWTRDGITTVDLSTWNVGNRTDADLYQTPLNSATVFNFFYPDYRYPGAMAQAGMTTPEFQLSNDSNTMNLTNAVTRSILSAGNTNGFTSYQSGGGAVTMDLGPYMTPAQTSDTAIPSLVDGLGILLTGGNLSGAAKTTISNYVANTANFPYTTPTNTQMRDRVRAIVQLILTSAEYAIQK